jgi:hypothetical protein
LADWDADMQTIGGGTMGSAVEPAVKKGSEGGFRVPRQCIDRMAAFVKKTRRRRNPNLEWRGNVSGVGSMDSDNNPHTGSSFESWLEDNDLLEDATSFAIKEFLPCRSPGK